MHWRPQPRIRLVTGHPDLLAIVEERKTWKRQQESCRELGSRHVATKRGHRARLVVVAKERRPTVSRELTLQSQVSGEQLLGRAGSYRLEQGLG